ncbi:putative 23S rRNA (uracil-5-)-methyltransferase RumB [Bacteriovorax sp. Seq25_V]|nr:putative 23S rRNA (uracil-5-)-methyltransferase RumB [Bacteriovorax sp. Seq25_V]
MNCNAFVEQRCRSCSLIEKNYHEALQEKIDTLSIMFPRALIKDAIETTERLGYRNKAKFVVGGTLEAPILGIPSPQDKFTVSPLLDCPIHEAELNTISLYIKESIKKFLLTPYSLETRTGEFKYLILTKAKGTEEVSIRFGMRSSESRPRVEKLAKELQEKFLNIKVISFEIQPKHAAIFEGDTYYLTEEKFIQHDFESFRLVSSTTNFFQVNSEVAKKLYDQIFSRYKDEDINLALDLFCGVGGFAFSAARFSNKVIGIELSENAIECAKTIQSPKVEFYCDDAIKFQEYNKEKVDLLIVNPPRRGIGEKFSNLICEIAPTFFVYSSCNPKTLKADSDIFEKEYELECLIPVDMFAMTSHLEVLSFWKRRKSL